MGGQTALNLAEKCEKAGLWKKYNVKILGADMAAIEKAEDRELFRKTMNRMGIPVCKAETANSFLKGKEKQL